VSEPSRTVESEVLRMEQEQLVESEEYVVAPSPAWTRAEDRDRYGSVPGLEDEELADPEELERVAFIEDWWPILALPQRKRGTGIRPEIDESGYKDWGAFGTVDFARICPRHFNVDWQRERVREELRYAVYVLGSVCQRVPVDQACLTMKRLRMGELAMGEIKDSDLWAVGKWYLRCRKLRDELGRLGEPRLVRRVR